MCPTTAPPSVSRAPRLASKNTTINNHLWSYSLGWVAHPRSQRMNQQRWVLRGEGKAVPLWTLCALGNVCCVCIWYFSVTKMGLFRLSLALSFSLSLLFFSSLSTSLRSSNTRSHVCYRTAIHESSNDLKRVLCHGLAIGCGEVATKHARNSSLSLSLPRAPTLKNQTHQTRPNAPTWVVSISKVTTAQDSIDLRLSLIHI